ncbi:MAG: cation-translocating P-type ATPase [Lachnospiraceae bacterium]|nr:cation-translocating P-type ATPase [Lachnospiraceae bacterium]
MDERVHLGIPSGVPEVLTGAEGLSEEQAAKLLAEGLGNDAVRDDGRTVAEIVAKNLFTWFNLLNVLLAVALAFVGAWRNMLFMGVVVSNTLIGTIQEMRARKTVMQLKLLAETDVTVLRDGASKTVSPRALVRGDLIMLHAGDQIPADAYVRSGYGSTDESLLTGESDPVSKSEGDWLLSGSVIVSGSFTAQLVYVGEASYANRLTKNARKIKPPKSALMNDLNRIVRFVSIALIPIGIALLVKQLVIMHEDLATAVTGAVAAMVGMIPEGLILLTSVALAVGVVRLGRRQTLVQELYGIETLARVDVLCLDKTGTITTGDMTMEQILPLSEASEEDCRNILRRFLGAGENLSPTLRALEHAVGTATEQPTAVFPFDSTVKKSAYSFADGNTYILGAPNFVWPESDMWRAAAGEATAQGLRVLLLCEAQGTIEDGKLPPVSRPLCLVALNDTLRANAEQTLGYFAEQGVTLKLISGDDPRTVSAIASRVQMKDADRWVDVSELTEEQLKDAVEKNTVLGRVTPERKRALVEVLKEAGHTVAMTGDGVNDIPALKASDCSIAMPGGSDAARHAAQLLLLGADFVALPAVVDEGRRVINNINRAASLFLVKTLYSFLLGLFFIFLPAAYPFQPIQLTLVSTLTIGAPSFFLALEPNRERVRGNFLRSVLMRAIPGALAVTLCALFAAVMEHFGWSHEVCSTLATQSAAVAGLVTLFVTCFPFSKMRAFVFAGSCVAMVIAVIFFRDFFFLSTLTGTQWLVQIALAAFTIAFIPLIRQIVGRGKKDVVL